MQAAAALNPAVDQEIGASDEDDEEHRPQASSSKFAAVCGMLPAEKSLDRTESTCWDAQLLSGGQNDADDDEDEDVENTNQAAKVCQL